MPVVIKLFWTGQLNLDCSKSAELELSTNSGGNFPPGFTLIVISGINMMLAVKKGHPNWNL